MQNNFDIIEPSKDLRDYVSCYYVLKSDDSNFSSKHYSFPHTYNALSIYKNCDFDVTDFSFTAKESGSDNFRMFVQLKIQKPLLVVLSGKIHRVTILFKDFGINHFIKEPLSAIMGCGFDQFGVWKEDLLIPSFCSDLFEADNKNEMGKIIDEFLLERFTPIEFSYLPAAVSMLCDFERNYNIDHIASHFNTSLRSFNRKFKEVLGVSPTEYRMIAKFRHSIQNKFLQRKFKRLTDIGYESNFYDQSYFTKIFHKLTGSNPTEFFKTIDRIGDDELIFRFIKE